jgi:hypothetical protein
MFSPTRKWLILALVSLAAILPAHALAETESVTFETVDEVTLNGTFYPSTLGDKAPCVMLLHGIGGSSQQPALIELAKSLQGGGYAVLTFDFRGHGTSTKVSSAFWKVSASDSIKGGNAKKTDIAFKDFSPGYLPMLVNDINAARRYLDLRNDARKCNSSNIIVIAPGEAALIGAMWIASEWDRRPMRTIEAGERPGNGPDILGAVWLSFRPSMGDVVNPVEKWIGSLRMRTPMAFIYGEDDKAAAKHAQTICNTILRVDTPPRPKLTQATGIKSKAAGLDLLNPALNDEIVKGLFKVVQEKGDRPWVFRDTRKTNLDFVPMKSFGYSLP